MQGRLQITSWCPHSARSGVHVDAVERQVRYGGRLFCVTTGSNTRRETPSYSMIRGGLTSCGVRSAHLELVGRQAHSGFRPHHDEGNSLLTSECAAIAAHRHVRRVQPPHWPAHKTPPVFAAAVLHLLHASLPTGQALCESYCNGFEWCICHVSQTADQDTVGNAKQASWLAHAMMQA